MSEAPILRDRSRELKAIKGRGWSPSPVLPPLWQEEFEDLGREMGRWESLGRQGQEHLLTRVALWQQDSRRIPQADPLQRTVVARMGQRLGLWLEEVRRPGPARELGQEVPRLIQRIAQLLDQQGALLQAQEGVVERIESNLVEANQNSKEGQVHIQERAESETLDCSSLAGRVLLSLAGIDLFLNVLIWIKGLV
jgi:hypothetical protein